MAVRRRMLVIPVAGIALLVWSSLQSGCQTTEKPRKSPSISPNVQSSKLPPGARRSAVPSTDPCASRLHDICGPLLFYYAQNHQLPATLQELSKMPGFEDVKDFTCPESHKPYVYNPGSRISPSAGVYVILYDPEATHGGFRYGVSIAEPEGNAQPVTKIIALSDSYFTGAAVEDRGR